MAGLQLARPYQQVVGRAVVDGALAADRPDIARPLAAALEAAP